MDSTKRKLIKHKNLVGLELLMRKEIQDSLSVLIKEKGFTQNFIAKITDLTQPKVSNLYKNSIDLSMGKLISILMSLGVDFVIDTRGKDIMISFFRCKEWYPKEF